MADRSPSRLGRYELAGLLATGGMAEIFLARMVGPSGFERPVVIKRILPHLARTREFTDMFVDEARIVAGIRHPNVVAVQELAHEDGELFLVMEYLEGESLGALLRRSRLKPEEVTSALCAFIVAEASAGLHAAHELTDDDGFSRDLVHRDVSPQNLFVTYRGQVKVLDFGVAKAANRSTRTEAGQVKGKFAYMSPEQCLGKPLDRRSDVFALGIVLWEMCCRRRLFVRPSEHLTFKAICEEPIPSPRSIAPTCPVELEEVCMKALSRDRTARHESALALRKDLLIAARKLGLGETPEEDLSDLMRALFAERMEQKQEMIRRVARGSVPHEVPVAEPEEDPELPSLVGGLSAEPTVPAEPKRTPSRRIWLLGGASVSAVGVLAFLALGSGKGPAVADATPGPVAVEEQPSAVPPAPPPSAVTEVQKVTLALETTPPGARIKVDGQDRGTTPSTVELPRGPKALTVELSRAGFVTRKEEVVPNMSQRLVLPLTAVPPKRSPTPQKPKEIPRFR